MKLQGPDYCSKNGIRALSLVLGDDDILNCLKGHDLSATEQSEASGHWPEPRLKTEETALASYTELPLTSSGAASMRHHRQPLLPGDVFSILPAANLWSLGN